MKDDAQKELLRGQNRTKRAIANSIAGELTDIIPKLNKTSQRLNSHCSALSASWEGAAAAAFVQSVRSIADRLSEMSNKAKTVSGAIKTAAEGAYPEI